VTDLLTKIENDSIRAWLHSVADEGYFKGRVLDYGCGKQPYRRLVEEHGGEYQGFDRVDYPANLGTGDVGPGLTFGVMFDAVLFTQVIQYALNPFELLTNMRHYTVAEEGVLVMTYPTNWPEVQEVDRWRFTKAGMEALLADAGYGILRHDRRATIQGAHEGEYAGYDFALGYGVVARAW